MVAKANSKAPKAVQAKSKEQRKQEAKAKQEQFSKMPPAKRLAIKVRTTANRLDKLIQRTGRFDAGVIAGGANPGKLLTEAVQSVRQAISALEAIPETFRPAGGGGRGSGPSIAVGTTVKIREKRNAQYMDDLSLAEMANLKVVEVRKSKLVCETSNKTRVFIPKAHVRVVEEAVAPVAAPAVQAANA